MRAATPPTPRGDSKTLTTPTKKELTLANLTPSDFENVSYQLELGLGAAIIAFVLIAVAAVNELETKRLRGIPAPRKVLLPDIFGGMSLIAAAALVMSEPGDQIAATEAAELVETFHDTTVDNIFDTQEDSVLTYIDTQGQHCNVFVGTKVSAVCGGQPVPERNTP